MVTRRPIRMLSRIDDNQVSKAVHVGIVLGAIAVACIFGPQPSAAADKLYYFVDERGVPHFSNVPADKRYKLLMVVGGPDATRSVPTPGVGAPVINEQGFPSDHVETDISLPLDEPVVQQLQDDH
ncbi:MAG TPA: DUF4124 domain-containing protein [Burkholderiales bacterium]|nr:DUF4124 domain-containing protein [Burkholderiales bacterium]